MKTRSSSAEWLLVFEDDEHEGETSNWSSTLSSSSSKTKNNKGETSNWSSTFRLLFQLIIEVKINGGNKESA
jgi:hypothetical protein